MSPTPSFDCQSSIHPSTHTISKLPFRRRPPLSPSLPPDCLRNIFASLSTDKRTLHACLLVNRIWCITAVEFLWSQPFRFLFTCHHQSCLCTCRARESQSAKLVDVYFICMIHDKINELADGGIVPHSVQKPMFPYNEYLRSLDLMELNQAVVDWLSFLDTQGLLLSWKLDDLSTHPMSPKAQIFEYNALLKYLMPTYGSDDILQIEDMAVTILSGYLTRASPLLRQLMIDNQNYTRGANEYRCSSLNHIYCDMFSVRKLLPTKGAHSLTVLTEFIATTKDNKTEVFYALSKVCRNLKRIVVNLDYPYRSYGVPISRQETESLWDQAQPLIVLIKNQLKLEDFEIHYCSVGAADIFDALKAQVNHLRKVCFVGISFSSWCSLKFLSDCSQLEVLRFELCEGLISATILDPLLSASFPNLNVLEFIASAVPEPILCDLLRKCSHTLKTVTVERALFYWVNPTRTATITVGEFCHSVRELNLSLWPFDRQQLVCIFSSCKHLVKVDISDANFEYDASRLMRKLSLIKLPNLRELIIRGMWSFGVNSLECFLKHSECSVEKLEFDGAVGIEEEHVRVVIGCLAKKLRNFRVTKNGLLKEEWIRRPKKHNYNNVKFE